MIERFSEPIPQDFIIGFFEAVDLYRDDWSPARPERGINVRGDFYSIGAVCGLVSRFGDRLPYNVLAELLTFMQADMDLAEKLISARSYAVGASCLLELMDRRKAHYRAQR